MEHAETVTFGGSALDRAAEIRGDADAMAAAGADPSARAILLWRGKVLIQKNRPASLLRLPLTHPILADARRQTIFLGREDAAPRFAHELSDWAPEDLDVQSLGAFLDPSEQTHPTLAEGEVFAELRRVMTWLSPRDAELAATARALFEWHRIHGFCANCGAATDMVQAGWQRACNSCGRQHFPRTDPVVIMLITRGNQVLIGRSPGWPERMYSLLAGFVEPGETIEAAVRREVFEESGIRVGAVSYLASQPWPFPASLMIGCHGVATSEEITIDPAELEHACWISREDMARVFADEHPDIAPSRKGAIARFLLENWLADTLE